MSIIGRGMVMRGQAEQPVNWTPSWCGQGEGDPLYTPLDPLSGFAHNTQSVSPQGWVVSVVTITPHNVRSDK